MVNGPDASDAVFVPGKLYEYLMARGPVRRGRRHRAQACGGNSCLAHDAPGSLAVAMAGLIGRRTP
ncbi:MAG: hypothetical protein ACYST0_14330, partial [Planctomycetota bacterium]